MLGANVWRRCTVRRRHRRRETGAAEGASRLPEREPADLWSLAACFTLIGSSARSTPQELLGIELACPVRVL